MKNREIRYRALWKDNLEVAFEGGWIEIHNFCCNYKKSAIDDLILLQSTTFKDKNGKEIFEGDILDVKFNTHYVERIYWKGPPDARAVVFWDYAGFRLSCKGEDDKRYADWTDTDGYFDGLLDMENSESLLIGDIYHNPDLVPEYIKHAKETN